MSYEDRVLALFADANPVPDDANLAELTRPNLQLIEQGEDTMSDTRVRAVDIDRPIVRAERNRGLLYGAAAAILALVVGTVGWIAVAGSDGETQDEAAAGTDPIGLIESFYERWSMGNVAGALELGNPGDWTDTSLIFIETTMDYVVAIEPDGWFWSVHDCAEQATGTFNCGLTIVGDPLLDAMGLAAGRGQFSIEDGKLTEVELGQWTRAADRQLATYAEQQDPVAYEAVCVGSNGRAWEENGVVYNRACGAFLSQYLEPLAAELSAP
jgi:hypothetical protein